MRIAQIPLCYALLQNEKCGEIYTAIWIQTNNTSDFLTG